MEEINDFYRQIINTKSKEIREKIKNSVCFGIKMDENNIDDLIVSAYLYGYNEASGNLYDKKET